MKEKLFTGYDRIEITIQFQDARVFIKKVIWIVYFKVWKRCLSNDHRYFIISDIIFYTHSWDLKKKRVIRGKCLFYGLYLRHLMLFPAFAFFFKNIVLYTFHP